MRINDFGGVKAPDITNLKNTVKYEPLRGKVCLLICTPSLDGKVNFDYTTSLLQTVIELSKLDIPVVIGKPNNSCFIDLARNLFVSQFMAGPFTHLLQIDSDMSWKPEDVLNLLIKDKEFIAGIGRKKLDNEEYAGMDYSDESGNVIGELGETEEDVLVKMKYIGGAFTLHKKSVFEKLQKKFVSLKAMLGTTKGHARNRGLFFLSFMCGSGHRYMVLP